MKNMQATSSLYTPELIAFAQTGVQIAGLLEQGASKGAYIKSLLELLPSLYGLMQKLPAYLYDPELDFLEEYINEASYERVRTKAESILGEDDMYLSCTTPDMQRSDSPIALHLSEQLADIYQHVGNLLGILRAENEVALPSAIGRCRLYWREHWGLALLSALSALHMLYAAESIEDDVEDEEQEDEDYYTED